MAQLVFVHGVATRDTPEYRTAKANRDELFRRLLFTGLTTEIRSPMWGKFAPQIPSEVFDTNEGVTTFSLNIGGVLPAPAGGMGLGRTAGGPAELSIGAIGKRNPVAALDAICSQIAGRAAREQRAFTPEELRAFATASTLIGSGQAATAFDDEADTQNIIDKLSAGAPSAFSIASKIGDAITAVNDRIANVASTLGFDALRGKLSPEIGLFLGDVFVYLKDGALRQQIRNEIGQTLRMAHSDAKGGKGPLVVVGHSMGGVILVDMLADLKGAGLPDDLSIDALLTVGSQPGLFAALDVVAGSAPAGSVRQKAGCVKTWFNVFDPIDPLAFRSDMLFSGAEDMSLDNVAGLQETHSKYFQRPQFFARSRKRLQDVGVLVR